MILDPVEAYEEHISIKLKQFHGLFLPISSLITFGTCHNKSRDLLEKKGLIRVDFVFTTTMWLSHRQLTLYFGASVPERCPN